MGAAENQDSSEKKNKSSATQTHEKTKPLTSKIIELINLESQ